MKDQNPKTTPSPPGQPAQPPPFPPSVPGESKPARVAEANRGLNQFSPGRDQDEKLISASPREADDARGSDEHWLWGVLWQTPSWLTSAVVHVAVILILALIPVQEEIRNSLSLILGLSDGSGEGEELTSFDLSTLGMEVESSEETGTDISLSVPEMEASVAELSNVMVDIERVPMTLKAGLAGRSGTVKGALLKAYGGTTETERAVAMGLEWLRKQQSKDGSWSLAGPFSDAGINENRSAATAMALLAFMGAGNTHREGDYRDNVARGLGYLLSIQDENGYFASKVLGRERAYSQAQASIAICELYGMTGDDELRTAAGRAVQWALDAQSGEGGWRYQPRQDSDTSVTGWYVMALISARMAGMEVDDAALDKIHNFLDMVQQAGGEAKSNPDGERYAYMPSNIGSEVMTAEGMLCRMYLGWKTTDERILRGCDYVLKKPISSEIKERNYYYWYYATNALHHAGGAAWFRWNNTMREVLPSLQLQSGRERGSWPPQGDEYGDAGGRLYSTVMAILCLEAYYRHMPLSEMAQGE
jgi:hypothetical protein